MSYLKKAASEYSKSSSKSESIAILQKYKDVLSDEEYTLILDSLCSLAMEGMFLNEKDILLNIAQVHHEATPDEIIEMVKTA